MALRASEACTSLSLAHSPSPGTQACCVRRKQQSGGTMPLLLSVGVSRYLYHRTRAPVLKSGREWAMPQKHEAPEDRRAPRVWRHGPRPSQWGFVAVGLLSWTGAREPRCCCCYLCHNTRLDAPPWARVGAPSPSASSHHSIAFAQDHTHGMCSRGVCRSPVVGVVSAPGFFSSARDRATHHRASWRERRGFCHSTPRAHTGLSCIVRG